MKQRGFSLIELLVVISIIVVLMGISLPGLLRAKDGALALAAMEAGVNDSNSVALEINDRSNRKLTDNIYMIKIDCPRKTRLRLKRPYPSGMKVRSRDGRDYILWKPKPKHLGKHSVTVVLKGKETSEREIEFYVYSDAFLEAQRENKEDPNDH